VAGLTPCSRLISSTLFPLSNSFKIFAICCGENLLRLIILFKIKIIILLLNSSVLREAYNCIRKYLSLIRNTFRNNKGAKYNFSYNTHEGIKSASLRFIPFSGHVSRLAHYYRHLYQLVKFIHFSYEDGLITKLELENILNTLRAQFTNEEVLLLYYNYRIGFGKNWDKLGEHKYPFFREYGLRHNIPLYNHIPKEIEHPLVHFKDFINEKRKVDPKFNIFEWQKN